MFDRKLKVQSAVAVAVAVAFAALAIAAPFAAADPAPLFIPHAQRGSTQPARYIPPAQQGSTQPAPRLGEGLSGADRSWLPADTVAVHVAGPADGFDWTDAGIGASTAVAVLLAVGGSLVVIRRRVVPAH